jgi:hypothetical protein
MLVVDSKRKHIYTEADPHSYEPKFSYGWRADLAPFDLAFDQIGDPTGTRVLAHV